MKALIKQNKSSIQGLLEYLAFIAFIYMKLRILHSHLHARYIDMNRLDDLIAIGSVIMISFWTLWLPKRARTISLAVLNVLLTALIFSDMVYYRYFGDFITIPVLMQAGQVGELGDSILSLIYWSDLWFIADWFLWALVIITITFRRKRRNQYFGHQYNYRTHSQLSFLSQNNTSRSRSFFKRLITGIVTFILGFVMTMGPIKHYTDSWAGELFKGNWWNMSLYNVTGLLGFHYFDTYRYTKEHLLGKPELSTEEMNDIENWFSTTKQNRYDPNDTFGAYKGSNVVVIQAEAFMNFMIGQSIHGQEITPNFNKLMKESLYFSNFYHQTGQGRTSDADFSSQTSLHPLPTGSVFVRYPDHTYDALPLILKENGYSTSAFHAYEGSFWNRTNMYRELGYDQFYSKKDYIIDEPLGWSLGDQSFFRQSLQLMSKNKEPFYSFLITLSSHHPYTLPEELQTLDTGKFKGTMFGDYLQSVHYVDDALGQLVAEMKEAGLWDNTILYFYGDHDNSITGKADYEKFLGKSLSDLDLHQIMNQVPLLVHLPDGQLTGIRQEPAGQLDMTPSLLHLLGISTEQSFMMGNNMFSNKNNDDNVASSLQYLVVQRSGAFSTEHLYYIPSSDNRFENGSCYNLSNRQLTNIEECRIPYDEAKKRLHISESIITSNLIPKLRE
ncbi:Phosphoglycerol transferase MdoB [Fontibacillus panacisegetis]|uniref:Phosphoglycerol transferase MdoB n=1 Tax=Fontibacillus panacisegetis TaxID=670482 RepID=A0A1G7MQI1_9BACL|nr:LTA synthase family protein [Fontibacillus panacisegetis]SDF64098.1 Phosphoglycerol transferase MdoB [Fontibacillus panacisegetis]